MADEATENPSVIVTVWLPYEPVGTVKIAPENEPWAFVVVAPLKATSEPANLAVRCEFAEKPEPETETEEPMLPLDGFSTIWGVIVNMELAKLVPSVAITE